jgi:hypothetical protein
MVASDDDTPMTMGVLSARAAWLLTAVNAVPASRAVSARVRAPNIPLDIVFLLLWKGSLTLASTNAGGGGGWQSVYGMHDGIFVAATQQNNGSAAQPPSSSST